MENIEKMLQQILQNQEEIKNEIRDLKEIERLKYLYKESKKFANGNQAGLDEIKRQYEERRKKLGV